MVGMNSKILLVGSVSVLAVLGAFFASFFINDVENDVLNAVEVQLEPYAFEDVCGYPVTDEMRLKIIDDKSTRFTHDGLSYLKVRGGVFTHVELAQHYQYQYPSLDYWYTLKNGKQVYFQIGACDIDDPNITLGESSVEYLKIKPETGEVTLEQISAPGFPMVNTVTMKPILDVENCQRVAKYYTTLQSHTMFTRENVTFDPIWKDQVFPLMDYCNDTGDFQMDIIGEKIKWVFEV